MQMTKWQVIRGFEKNLRLDLDQAEKELLENNIQAALAYIRSAISYSELIQEIKRIYMPPKY